MTIRRPAFYARPTPGYGDTVARTPEETSDPVTEEVPLLISLQELAEVCGVTRQTIVNHIKRGLLKASKNGHRWVIEEPNARAYYLANYSAQKPLRERA